MKRTLVKRFVRVRSAIAMLLPMIFAAGTFSQPDAASKESVVGAWKLISVDNVKPDGSREPRHGAHPAGLLIFDPQGHYSMIVLTEGTPEEYKAAVEGNNADYGRYTVQESDHTITFYMDRASHRELEGSSHTRFFTLEGNRLIYTTARIPKNAQVRETYGEVVFEKAW